MNRSYPGHYKQFNDVKFGELWSELQLIIWSERMLMNNICFWSEDEYLWASWATAKFGKYALIILEQVKYFLS
jgi:hypothetical protein